MEKLTLLFWVFSFWIMQVVSNGEEATLISVQIGENISLSCSMDSRYEISWYHQISHQLTHIISAKMSTVAGRKLLVTFNRNHERLKLNADVKITTVSLLISGLSESDLGFYFCGKKSAASEIIFDKPFRLHYEDTQTDKEDKGHSVTEQPKDVESITDGVMVTERVLMFGGAALAIFVFFLATFLAGGVIHQQGWQKGWAAAKRSTLMRHKSAK
ncbi:uncharacterized protein LOC130246987 [Danio aesculapii]|uniref:uncharacterized protein LOC130246987 n=1 Tax=Danio aesculapii TaxID=1142201 RepID=UPI0024C0BAFC|nr:uncharacterized protein LOC130246987 [Danio aesculapii]